jgi:predicted dehydrogenase/threonine dehydrogenase-like Zn-dependent dehydrogenase
MLQILQSYKSGELWLAEVPVPACREGGVVVRTAASFVSAGTERMLVEFARKSLIGKAVAMPDQVRKVIRAIKSEGLSAALEKVNAKLDQPIPLGYSCAGVVEEAGSSVAGLAKGDCVACGGALYANHAEFNYVPRNLVVKIPEGVSFEDASCATVGSIALQGVRQCDVRLGETVCVLGLGLLGILAVQLLKASGLRVIGFDPDKARCELAKQLGADEAVSENIEAACDAFSRGYGVDAVLITAATHSNQPVETAGNICCVHGTVVATGMVGMDIPRDAYYKKELSFKLSCSYGPGRYDPTYEEAGHDYPFGHVRWTEQRNIGAFLECVAAGTVTPSRLVTHRFAIDKALDAYDLLSGKTQEPYLGIVLTYPEKQPEITPATRRMPVVPAQVKNAPASDKAAVGLIGAGSFARAILLPHLKKIREVRLRAVCDASGMAAAETARKAGFEFAATDFRQLLDDKEINTVIIATRHDTHAKFAAQALSAGKHVHVEKPLALTPEELLEIKKAAAGSSRILTVGFNRRFSPHAALIRTYFDGRQTPMTVAYRVNAGSIPKSSWIQDRETGGGRIIGEVCHFIDFCSFIIRSSPLSVRASCIKTANEAIVAEDSCVITLDYEDGSLATIVYAALGSAALEKERCEFFADGSSAIMENFEKTVCSGKRGGKTLKGKQDKGYGSELRAFVNAVKAGGPPPIPLQSLLETTAATFAALASLRSGAKQEIRV